MLESGSVNIIQAHAAHFRVVSELRRINTMTERYHVAHSNGQMVLILWLMKERCEDLMQRALKHEEVLSGVVKMASCRGGRKSRSRY